MTPQHQTFIYVYLPRFYNRVACREIIYTALLHYFVAAVVGVAFACYSYIRLVYFSYVSINHISHTAAQAAPKKY